MNKIKNVGYSPVRVEKIEEAKKILEIIKAGEMQQKSKYKKPTMMQKLYDIFIDGREKIEDGLSIKELALILYPDLITIDMVINPKNDSEYLNVFCQLKKTRTTISRFRAWKKNKEIVLYPRQTPSGKWLYYNIMDKKEFEEVELRLAKVILAYQKMEQKVDQVLSMRPEEREEKTRILSEKINERARKRAARKK